MTHGMSGRIEAFQIDRIAHLDDVAGGNAGVNIRNYTARFFVRNEFRARRANNTLVAAYMVEMIVSVEDLRNRPAAILGNSEAFPYVERIDGEGLAGLGAGNQVVEVAIVVPRPYLLDNHSACPPCT